MKDEGLDFLMKDLGDKVRQRYMVILENIRILTKTFYKWKILKRIY